MRKVLIKLIATAGLGVAMSMSVAAPSYAFTDNVKDATSYFFDCLAKLGTDENCGGPHEMNKGTGSLGSVGYKDIEHCRYVYGLFSNYCCHDSKNPS